MDWRVAWLREKVAAEFVVRWRHCTVGRGDKEDGLERDSKARRRQASQLNIRNSHRRKTMIYEELNGTGIGSRHESARHMRRGPDIFSGEAGEPRAVRYNTLQHLALNFAQTGF